MTASRLIATASPSRASTSAPSPFRNALIDLCFERGFANVTVADLEEWRARLRTSIYALYRYLAADERLRRFVLVEARAAGERPALLLGAEVEALYDLIDEGRAEPTAPPTLTRVTAESLGGGIFTQISLAAEPGGPMPPEEELVPAMMYLAVLPYLGASAAAEELRIPAPPR